MHKLCGTQLDTSEQQKASTPSMQKRDEKDTATVTDFFKERNPFKGGEQLRIISSGVILKGGIPDIAKEIGEAIVCKLPGLKVNEVTFRRKDTVQQLKDKVGLRIDGDRHNPANVPPPSKPDDSIFGKTNKSYRMKVNITI